MSDQPVDRVSAAELAAESVTALPAKEVMSLLDLNANLDLALDTAAPINLAIGANANIAAPIDAAVNANVLSPFSTSEALSNQGAEIHQGVVGNAEATSHQGSTIAQGNPAPTSGGAPGVPAPIPAATTGSPTSGNLLDVNVNLNANLHLASPIDGAVAANANVAAPIDAAASANIGSVGAESVASAHQVAIIDQNIHGDAVATGNQASGITQGPTPGK